MAAVVIENPNLNSPIEEPMRRFRADKDRITNLILESQRVSYCFASIAEPFDGGQKHYVPDFIAILNEYYDFEDLLNLSIEVTGEKKKESKVSQPRHSGLRHLVTTGPMAGRTS